LIETLTDRNLDLDLDDPSIQTRTTQTLLLHQQPQRSLGSSLDHLVSHRLHDG